VDRRLSLEELLVHLELAKVSSLVAEPFQHGAHVGQVRIKTLLVGVLHLIEDAADLGWLAGEERRARRRAHGRRDVMVPERNAVAGNRIEGRQRIIGPRKQSVSPLVNDQENDVVKRLVAGARTWGASRLLRVSNCCCQGCQRERKKQSG